MANEIAVQLLAAALKLVSAIVLPAGALYTGIGVLDRLTAGIDEWKEIKKGNVAVGILYATVMLSMIMLIGPRIEDFITLITPSPVLTLLCFAFVNYLIGLVFAIVVVYLAINVMGRLTTDLEEMAELRKGNVAVALIMSALLLAVVLVSTIPAEHFFTLIKSWELSLL